MQAYQINELERLTGIKSHTIRIWEKRYDLIRPHRTKTNRRYYDDEQVRKLLNVTTLLSQGFKISKIAGLSEQEINKQVLNYTTDTQENIIIGYINSLIKAMLAFDEISFEKLFKDAVQSFGIYHATINVIYPFLNKTGILWKVNKTSPAQEHFAINIIRRKLLTAIDALPNLPQPKNKFLLFLPQSEWHEITLIFADYVIRSNGGATIYLGQNVPYANVRKVATTLSPQYVLLFYTIIRPQAEIETQINDLSKNLPGTHILISGNSEILKNIKSFPKNTTYLTDVNSILTFLK